MINKPQMPFIQAGASTFEKGRLNNSIDMLIIHTMAGYFDGTITTFKNASRKASAQYLVGWMPGQFAQMVNDEDTAYHAANYEVNLRSIGIEFEDKNDPHGIRPTTLYENGGVLIAYLSQKYNIPLDREHIKGHHEVSKFPTECPAHLNIDLLIEYAKKAIQGGTVPTPSYQTTPFTRNIIVSNEAGLNVRDVPSVTGNIVKVIPFKTSVAVESFLTGGDVNGNATWYKVRDSGYMWAGATNVPSPTVTPEAPVVTPPAATLSLGELQANYDLLAEKINIMSKANTDLMKENESLKVSVKSLSEKNIDLMNGNQNGELLITSNKVLSEEIEAYKLKVSEMNLKLRNAYVSAFDKWVLIDIPHGVMAIAKLPVIALRVWALVLDAARHNYVIGWKRDAQLIDSKDAEFDTTK